MIDNTNSKVVNHVPFSADKKTIVGGLEPFLFFVPLYKLADFLASIAFALGLSIPCVAS